MFSSLHGLAYIPSKLWSTFSFCGPKDSDILLTNISKGNFQRLFLHVSPFSWKFVGTWLLFDNIGSGFNPVPTLGSIWLMCDSIRPQKWIHKAEIIVVKSSQKHCFYMQHHTMQYNSGKPSAIKSYIPKYLKLHKWTHHRIATWTALMKTLCALYRLRRDLEGLMNLTRQERIHFLWALSHVHL